MKSASAIAAVATIAVAVATPVFAADVAGSWDMAYVGVDVGYARGTSTITGNDWGTDHLTGAAAGTYAGKNWQAGPVVYGLETDSSYVGANGTDNMNLGPLPPPSCCSSMTTKTQMSSVNDLRGRVGYTAGPWMVYGVGGASLGAAEVTTPADRATKNMMGWNAGAGVERQYGQGLALRIEYSRTDFGRVAEPDTAAMSNHAQIDLDRVVIGVSRSF